MAVGTTQKAGLDEFGHEVPDPTPLQIPAGFKRPETLAEQVQRLVRGAISRQAAEEGMETFEESEDFDIPDDPDDPSTQYEEYFDPTLGRAITAQEFRENFDVYRRRFVEAEMKAWQVMDQSEALRRRRPREEPKSSRAASERVSKSEGGKAPPPEDED